MSVVDQHKSDCHCHVFDPSAFPYVADRLYRPAGHEIATAAQIARLFADHDTPRRLFGFAAG